MQQYFFLYEIMVDIVNASYIIYTTTKYVSQLLHLRFSNNINVKLYLIQFQV